MMDRNAKPESRVGVKVFIMESQCGTQLADKVVHDARLWFGLWQYGKLAVAGRLPQPRPPGQRRARGCLIQKVKQRLLDRRLAAIVACPVASCVHTDQEPTAKVFTLLHDYQPFAYAEMSF